MRLDYRLTRARTSSLPEKPELETLSNLGRFLNSIFDGLRIVGRLAASKSLTETLGCPTDKRPINVLLAAPASCHCLDC